MAAAAVAQDLAAQLQTVDQVDQAVVAEAADRLILVLLDLVCNLVNQD